MAILHSIQSGNFTDPSTWGLVDPASALITKVTTVTLSTSISTSNTFVPGAITVQGVSIQFSGVATIPSGTLTVELYNSTTSSSIRTITINVTDLTTTGGVGANNFGWVYFKFLSNVTLVSGNSYSIRMSTSVASMVSVYSSASTNFSRVLITTTSQAPASTDILIISGEHTSTGINSIYEVTMNSISNAIVYGVIYVSCRGTLNYGILPITSYKLKLAGDLVVSFLGILQIGSETSPIPDDSNASLELSCTVLNQYRILVYGGTFITFGKSMSNVSAKLDADVAIGNTTSTTNISTDWKSGDKFIITGTNLAGISEIEILTLSSDSVGTSISHQAYTKAHGGNSISMVQADLYNMNRNILIFSTSPTLRAGMTIGQYSTINWNWTYFYDLTALTCTITTQGSVNVQNNVVTSTLALTSAVPSGFAFSIPTTATSNISNNLFYRVLTLNNKFNDNNMFIGSATLTGLIGNNNVITNSNDHGFQGVFAINSTGNSIYCNTSIGWYTISNLSVYPTVGVTNLRSWRNGASGIVFHNASFPERTRTQILDISDSYFFGNGGQAISSNNRSIGKFVFNNCFFWGGTTRVTAQGVIFGQTTNVDSLYFNNCTFGKDHLGNLSPFSTACILYYPGSFSFFNNCIFSGTEVAFTTPNSTITAINANFGFVSTKHNGITGAYKMWNSTGVQSSDTSQYVTTSPSLRITPTTAARKTFTPMVKVPVKSGNSCTVSVNVRKSITADGTINNGANPRLMYAYNPLSGNFAETVGATYSTPTDNLLQFPQNFEQTIWGKINATLILGSTAAPDGTLTATRITNTTNTYVRCDQSVMIIPGNYYIHSCYIKRGNYRYASTFIGNPGEYYGSSIQYDFDTNVVSNTASTGNKYPISNVACTPVGGGWYRLSYRIITPLDLGNLLKISGPYATPFWSGSTTGNYLFIWGSKLEVGSTLTDYVTPGGVWQTLSYTTPPVTNDSVLEFYVDCDGTSGWINVDDWNTTTNNDSRGLDYWGALGTYTEPDYRKGGGTYTFAN